MKRILGLFLMMVIVLGASITANAADGIGTPQVRFVHALAGATAVDVFVDDARQLSGINYSSYSGYFTVSPGTHRIKIFKSGTTELLVENEASYETGKIYTIFAIGREGQSREFRRFENQTATPDLNRASVRFMHASQGAPVVRVCETNTDDCRINEVAFGVASPYATFDSRTYNFDIRLQENNQIVYQEPNVRFGNRGIYTLVALGLPDSNPPLDIITIVDSGGIGVPPVKSPNSGAFFTPTMFAVLGGLAVLLLAMVWGIWRVARWGYGRLVT